MDILLDTHVLLWTGLAAHRLPEPVAAMIDSPDNTVHVSMASLWEIAIKNGLGRADFHVSLPEMLPRMAAAGIREMAIAPHHILWLERLPAHHRDPFDRMLVAQANCENALLLTADRALAQYAGPIRLFDPV